MKKLLITLILTPGLLISQNACKTCSEFSKSNNWSDFLECVSEKIKIENNINDYMCRASSYGFAFGSSDSIKSFNKKGKYIQKKEALDLAIKDYDIVIELDSTFANGMPFKLRSEIKKQLGKNYCEDLKKYCRITKRCNEYERECQK
jgi:hypothetical protein